MRREKIIDLYINNLCNIAKANNAKIYLVGGAVRDFFLDKETQDYDFVVFGDLDKIAVQFASQLKCKYIKYEKKLKTFRIFCRIKTIDITKPRGATIEDDLRKRDFTINSIAYDFDNDIIIDPLNGRDDITKKVIRINHDNCFKNDPIRIIRAFRLAALNRFDIEPFTFKIAQKDSYLLKHAASERITDELKKFLSLNNTFAYLLLMDKAGVIDSIFEDLSLTNGCIQSEHHLFDVKTHSLSVYNFIEWSFNRLDKILGKCYRKYLVHFSANKGAVLVSLKLAALFHDAGKPFSKIVTQDGKVRFPHHETKSSELFKIYAKQYSFGKHITKLTKFFIEKHIEPSYIFSIWDKGELGFEEIVDYFLEYGEYGIDLLFFALADTLAKGKISAVKREVYVDFLRFMAVSYYNKIKPKLNEKPILNGQEILDAFNHIDKKQLNFIINEVKKAYITGKICTKKEALRFVEKLL